MLNGRHAQLRNPTPLSSPGPLTPPTPQASPLAPLLSSKPSRTSLRPPKVEHAHPPVKAGPKPRHVHPPNYAADAPPAYSPDARLDRKVLKDRETYAPEEKPGLNPNLQPPIHGNRVDPSPPEDPPLRNLKDLEAFGVRFVQRTDDMRGTQVLARDSDFAVDVEYLSKVSNLASTAASAVMPRRLEAR